MKIDQGHQASLLLVVLCLGHCAGSSDLRGGQAERSCAPEPGRQTRTFDGEISWERSFVHGFGPGFEFKLLPDASGWIIAVTKTGDDELLTRLTPPLHGPNPTVIEGWHFRNEDNTGPNDGGLNVPGGVRRFIFSPEVPELMLKGQISLDDVHRVEAFGHGELRILDYGLADLRPGQRARMVWMKFEVCVSWPEGRRAQ